MADPPPESTWTLAALARAVNAVPEATRRRAARAFLEDPRDRASPAALARLLEMVARGDALAADGTQLLLDMMARTSTGPGRLPAQLPPGTPVAHRTGTGGSFGGVSSAVNDAGIITLPDGAGRVVVVVLVTGTTRPLVEVERAVAGIGRAAYAHFAR